MNQLTAEGIVLSRTDYGEADRIITLLTQHYGKLRLMARGVRKVRSKLAGGIELFSVSDITFIRGRGEIGTLVSARLRRHFGRIVSDIHRVQSGYDLIRLINKNTEDEVGEEYFVLMEQTLEALDDTVSLIVIRTWFQAQLLRLGGHSPSLRTDAKGQKLSADDTFTFSFDDMAFAPSQGGRFTSGHVKFLRLMFGDYGAAMLQKLLAEDAIVQACSALVQSMFSEYLRV